MAITDRSHIVLRNITLGGALAQAIAASNMQQSVIVTVRIDHASLEPRDYGQECSGNIVRNRAVDTPGHATRILGDPSDANAW